MLTSSRFSCSFPGSIWSPSSVQGGRQRAALPRVSTGSKREPSSLEMQTPGKYTHLTQNSSHTA